MATARQAVSQNSRWRSFIDGMGTVDLTPEERSEFRFRAIEARLQALEDAASKK